jgi:S1-C subfamily serine protease
VVPRRRLGITILPILLTVLALLVCARCFSLRKQNRPPRIPATTPADPDALRSLQERIQGATRRVIGAVVAVEEPQPAGAARSRRFRPYCSGVIITPDGLILSEFHVSHQLPGEPDASKNSRRPGERTTVILDDGRELQAELLGANQTFDLSLLRMVGSGPYPYVPLDPSAMIELGDWVLKLGHPMGYRQGRPPVVRLGRVLFQQSNIFVTDCLTTGGDSGGPFFDLGGRLVGIIGNGSVPAKPWYGLRGPDRMGPLSAKTNRLIQQHFDPMLRCEIAPFDEKAWERFQRGYLWVEDDEILRREHWTQGDATASAFHAVIRDARPSAVSILDELGRDVVLGAVVRADGWIATIASMLPAQPQCRLSDGWIVDAQVVGMDSAFDLALLKIRVTGLPAVRWAEKPPLVRGTILAAVGTPENPLGIGVVSVPRRDLPGPFPTHVRRPTILPQPLWIAGQTTAGGYVVDMCSANAGFLRGDIILSIAGREIHSEKDAHDCVDGHQAGERLPVRLIRDGKRLDLSLELVAEPMTNAKPYADFPTLFEHDIPVSLGQCGGPLIDLNGKAVGITMYRGTYGCMAIPGDCVERLLPELMKPGRLGDRWIKPPAATVGNHGPSGRDKIDPARR